MIVFRIYSIEYNVNTTLIIHVSKAVKNSCKSISCLIWIRPKQTKRLKGSRSLSLNQKKKEEKKERNGTPREYFIVEG